MREGPYCQLALIWSRTKESYDMYVENISMCSGWEVMRGVKSRHHARSMGDYAVQSAIVLYAQTQQQIDLYHSDPFRGTRYYLGQLELNVV